MKTQVVLLGTGLALLAMGAWREPQNKPKNEWTVILGGDTDGYLSPCGCTEPMTGGFLRRVRATKSLSLGPQAIILDNGSFVSGTSQQDVYKAQTMAQALALMNVTAINFAPADARLGLGVCLSLQQWIKGKSISTTVAQSALDLPRYKEAGPFVVAAVSADEGIGEDVQGRSVSVDEALQEVSDIAKSKGKFPLLLLQGNKLQAEDLAKRFPALVLIQYRSAGDPPSKLERVGNTVLATPGERAKSILRLVWKNDHFSGYSVVRLGPEIADDPDATRLFNSYLDRVAAANLLEQLPRSPSEGFAGSAACRSCHLAAYKVWAKSQHSHALTTLEHKRESRDPDCVGCHVTGLTSSAGFRSRQQTPQLAFVGCESCHGPAQLHAAKPKIKLPRVETKLCVTCHSSLNSPNFDFKAYWARIRH